MDLKNIGFYSMSDDRVKNVSDHSQMKRCEMIITEYCNFRCPYCKGIKDTFNDRKIKQMELSEIKTAIDYWCENQPLKNIRFSGGEPTLHQNIVDVISYAKSKGITRIAISTNGSNKLDLYKRLIDCGVNDISVSLDADNSEIGDKMAGNIKGSFDIVVKNIEELSKLTYITTGIVLTPDNVQNTINIVKLADQLGVADIRVIPSAQYNQPIPELVSLDNEILDRHPILKFRVQNYIAGNHVRGLKSTDSKMCGLVLDDSVIAGQNHYSCVIAFRERAKPIGKVGPNMRQERKEWMMKHNCLNDNICMVNCIDACKFWNLKFREYHPEYF